MTAPRLVLASASPRRRDLLSRLNVRFEVDAADIEENAGDAPERPERAARRLARAKARAVARLRPGAAVLAADTIVAHRGELLGKPRDAKEARAMLRRLRGRPHRVVTAVAAIPAGRRRTLVDHAVTRVVMRAYPDEEIDASIARGDPFDKAGGYAIQDQRLAPVTRYEGCYCNVVGLPLWLTTRLLERAGTVFRGVRLSALPEQCRGCPLRPAAASR